MRLVTEVHETRETLKELSNKLSHIETRLKRAFPLAFPKKNPGRPSKTPAEQEPPTITAEQALALYEELLQHAKKEQFDEVRNRLQSLGTADLSFLRRELGGSLGRRKPSQKTLIEIILRRLKESVMLSKHTNRQEQLERRTEASQDSDRTDDQE